MESKDMQRCPLAKCSALLPGLWLISSLHAADAPKSELVTRLNLAGYAHEIVWLPPGANHFFALFKPAPAQSPTPQRAAIIVHDTHEHADWPEVISPLRNGLPPWGIATLSVQLNELNKTVVANGAIASSPPLSGPMGNVVDYLKSRHYTHITLICHGATATLCASYLTTTSGVIDSFVGISMGNDETQPAATQLLQLLPKLSLPILDIYAANDITQVTATAQQRAQAQATTPPTAATATTNNKPLYEQRTLAGENHAFSLSNVLIRRVAGWIRRLERELPAQQNSAGESSIKK